MRPSKKRPRLLVPLSIQFSVRYILRTGLLDQIREVADPVVLLAWKDDELRRELEDTGVEVHALPELHWGLDYQRIRGYVNFLHQQRLRSPSTQIWERRANVYRTPYARVRRHLRQGTLEALSRLPGVARWVWEREENLFWNDTSVAEFEKFLDELRIDVGLSLTPFLRDEEALMRVCSNRGLPLCASILSFDNITTRGWIPVHFQRYLVWNKYNAGELLRAYPYVSNEAVGIVGSPQFDFYWDHSNVWPEHEWRQQLGLPPERPVILLAGGFYFCAPQEPEYIRQLDEAIESGEIPGRPIVLFRNHPVDPIERWLPVLEHSKNVVYDDPSPGGRISGKTNMRMHDIQKLASCLYHSSVHINVASTMTIDGAIFDRPQIGPAYDDRPDGGFDRTSKDLYLHEHYLPITNSGGLQIVNSRQELITAVRSALEDPGRLWAGRKRLVEEICTFTDGRATERVAQAVRGFILSAADRSEAVGDIERAEVG